MAKLIIIITEQTTIISKISHILSQSHYFVVKGSHPDKVIEVIKSLIPDMIIIDENFGKDALMTFSKNIQLNSHTRNITIAMLASASYAKTDFYDDNAIPIIYKNDLLERPLMLMQELLRNSI